MMWLPITRLYTEETADACESPEDAEDLANAHLTQTRKKTLWSALGPGLITGSADDDPSGIGTYSVAGAQFGYGLLSLTPVCLPLMIAVQGMCGRIAAITGKGLPAVLKEHYSRRLLLAAVILLFVANTINVWADLNVMAASAEMMFKLPHPFWLLAVTFGTVVLTVTFFIIICTAGTLHARFPPSLLSRLAGLQMPFRRLISCSVKGT